MWLFLRMKPTELTTDRTGTSKLKVVFVLEAKIAKLQKLQSDRGEEIDLHLLCSSDVLRGELGLASRCSRGKKSG